MVFFCCYKHHPIKMVPVHQLVTTHMALWLLWHSVSSILGSGLGPLGMWFGLGTSSSSGCWSPIWVSLKSALPVILLDRLGGSDFTSSGIPGAKCREEWWRGPEKHSWAVLPIVQSMDVSLYRSFYVLRKEANNHSSRTHFSLLSMASQVADKVVPVFIKPDTTIKTYWGVEI